MSEFVYIESQGDLEKACLRWRRKPVLALDTEFVRVRTFFPQLGLIQVADDEGAVLVDPLAVESLACFADVLADTRIVKVLHSCSEDLEVFFKACGQMPTPLFDTQIAASFLGLGMNLGYARLVNDFLGIEISKDSARTDWLKRPLTAEQLRYAAADVTHLLAIYPSLAERIANSPQCARFEEDCAALLDLARFTLEPEKAYRRVKQSFRLKPQQLAVLQALAAWREDEAVARDLVRRFLVSDEALIALAMRQPRNASGLQSLEDISPIEIRKHGAQLINLIEQSKDSAPEHWPAPILRPIDIPGMKTALTAAKAAADAIATAEGLAPELLASNRLLEGYLMAAIGAKSKPPKAFNGWRGELLVPALAVIVEALKAEQCV